MKCTVFFLATAVTIGSVMISTEVAAAEVNPHRTTPATPKHRSPGRMYTGMVLTGIGGAAIVGGGGYFIYDANWGSGYGAVLIAAPVMLLGFVFAGVGIPLWITGARPPESPALQGSAIPTIAMGPRSVALQWKF